MGMAVGEISVMVFNKCKISCQFERNVPEGDRSNNIAHVPSKNRPVWATAKFKQSTTFRMQKRRIVKRTLKMNMLIVSRLGAHACLCVL